MDYSTSSWSAGSPFSGLETAPASRSWSNSAVSGSQSSTPVASTPTRSGLSSCPQVQPPQAPLPPPYQPDAKDSSTVESLAKNLSNLTVTDEGYDAHLVVIVDESGSMSGLTRATISGVNELINSHRGLKETFTLVKFNGQGNTRFVYFKAPINTVQEFTNYNPEGGTALDDAVGATITKLTTNHDLFDPTKITPYNLSGVFMRVFTDGEENESRDYTCTQIAALINKFRAQPYGWNIEYIGCNTSKMLERTQAAHAMNSGASFSSVPATNNGVTSAYRQISASCAQYSALRSSQRASTVPVPANVPTPMN